LIKSAQRFAERLSPCLLLSDPSRIFALTALGAETWPIAHRSATWRRSNVRVSGDTGASGQNLWAYTAQFGNGFSGTLSLEDPATRKGGGTIDVTQGSVLAQAPFFGLNGAIVNDNGMTINAGPGFGFRVPDIIANLRVDQAWGFAGISAALHDASGAYYQTPNLVNNGHPEDKYGWALAGGAKFNLPGGDMVGFNVCYTEGAAGMCTNQTSFGAYDSSTSVGVGWITDGVFGNGTQIEFTRVWSALAAYEHIWNPKWRTAVGGGYVDVHYDGAARNLINARLPWRRSGELRCGRGSRGVSASVHPRPRQQLQSGLQLLGSLYPHPVEPGAAARYRSAGDVYPPQHRVQRRGGGGGERVTPRGRSHRRPEHLVRDVPLAAQLLSMIA
jgi:hypothetical protein